MISACLFKLSVLAVHVHYILQKVYWVSTLQGTGHQMLLLLSVHTMGILGRHSQGPPPIPPDETIWSCAAIPGTLYHIEVKFYGSILTYSKLSSPTVSIHIISSHGIAMYRCSGCALKAISCPRLISDWFTYLWRWVYSQSGRMMVPWFPSV